MCTEVCGAIALFTSTTGCARYPVSSLSRCSFPPDFSPKGNRDEARPLLERAYAIRRTKLGEAHGDTRASLKALQDLDNNQEVGEHQR